MFVDLLMENSMVIDITVSVYDVIDKDYGDGDVMEMERVMVMKMMLIAGL